MQDRKFFTSMAAALFFMAGITTSCVNDDVLNQESLDARKPISFTTNIASRSISQTIQDTQIESGNKVGVFVTKGTGTGVLSTLHVDNQELTSDGKGALNVATGAEPIYFPDGIEKVDVYAYAPYNAAFTTKLNGEVAFSVQTDQSTNEGLYKSDFMIAKTAEVATNTTEPVELNFKHKLVKLNLNFKVSQDATEADTKFFSGATVSVVNVKTGVTVKVSDGTLTATTAEASADGIKAATFAETTPVLTASVIFPPQEIAAGTVLIKVTNKDKSETRTGTLNQKVEFMSGVRYLYDVELKDGGLQLTPKTQITDWEDMVISPYNVGDYIAKDGTIIAKGATDKSNAVAVIFSTKVSATDATAGYKAYAMWLKKVGSKFWSSTNDVLYKSVSTFTDAFNDLDGRTETEKIVASDVYKGILAGTNLPDGKKSDNYAFEYFTRADSQTPISGQSDKFSGLFAPSIGQMIQILNNLGEAGISLSSTIEDKTSAPIYTVATDDVLTNINKYFTGTNGDAQLDTNGASIYITSTEDDTRFWCLQTDPSEGANWGFGRNAGKSSMPRTMIPCIAIK